MPTMAFAGFGRQRHRSERACFEPKLRRTSSAVYGIEHTALFLTLFFYLSSSVSRVLVWPNRQRESLYR
jgi:hypothetical protein